MRVIEGKVTLEPNTRVAIIASRFNHIITDRLIEGARDCFVRHGGDDKNLDLIWVPGAYEIPFVLDKVLSNQDREDKKYDGICTLGAIIRGSTPHFDYVSAESIKGIANVTMKYSGVYATGAFIHTPVTFGVLTTDSIEQAIERAGSKVGNKGFDAMSGLIELINLYKKI